MRSIATVGITLIGLGTLALPGNAGRLAITPVDARVGSRHAAVPANDSEIAKKFGQLPLSFEANAGQTDARVKFLSRGSGYTVFLTADDAVLVLTAATRKNRREKREKQEPGVLSLASFRDALDPRPEPAATNAVVRMRLVGANRSALVSGLEPLPGTANYFVGKDPKNWRTGVTNYSKVRYRSVYPGIDLVYYGNQGHLEYDFVVGSGIDPKAIQLSFGKSATVRLDRSTGDLVVSTAGGDVRFQRPVAYQMVSQQLDQQPQANQDKRFIDSRFVLTAENAVTFQFGAYDHAKPLVVDPVLSYSTYLGGTSNDYATSIAVDSTGSAYITGYTTSANFPVTPGAYQSTCGGGTCTSTTIDAFVTKLNSAGTALLYSTYLGGSGKDYGYSVALDPSGDAFIAGTTFSTDFPVTSGAFQVACGGNSCASGDGFITELNTTGSGLVYSTYLGGSSTNQVNAIALDASGNAYVTGYTKATNFPITAGAFQPKCSSCTAGFVDSFVAKLNSSGSAVVYSSYLGGNSADVGYAITLDSAENAYVTGYTYSTTFPTTAGAFQNTSNGPTAAFLSKINPTGTALVYSTYLGGNATGSNACPACATSVAVDASGEAYVVGLTWETNFPTTAGAYQVNFAGGFHDAFVTKFNSTGSGLVYSTYIGGTGDDGATSVVLDSTGIAYIKGNTFSTNFPTTPGALKGTHASGSSDAFVVLLNPVGSALNYSTYLGGSASEYGSATAMITIDNQLPPNIYVTGYSDSTDFPVTPGAYQTKLAGLNDGFVTKFAPSPNVGLSPGLNFGNQNDGTTSAPLTITVTNTGNSTLNVSSVALSGTNASDFKETNTCTSGGVAPQATCAINVTFSPTISGTENATVTVTDDAPDSPESTTLTGTGVGGSGPVVSLSPTSLVFASQLVNTTSPAQNVTLTNTGTAALSITSIATTGNFAETDTCGSSVAAGGSCTISVTFTPTTVNTRTGTVSITDNAPGSPQAVTLSGTGTYITWTPASLNFGAVTVGKSSSSQAITLTNHAGTALTIKSVTTTGVNNQDFTQTNTCGSSLAKGASCTITVTFTPKAIGTRAADVTVADFLGGNATQNIPLSGTGQ